MLDRRFIEAILQQPHPPLNGCRTAAATRCRTSAANAAKCTATTGTRARHAIQIILISIAIRAVAAGAAPAACAGANTGRCSSANDPTHVPDSGQLALQAIKFDLQRSSLVTQFVVLCALLYQILAYTAII